MRDKLEGVLARYRAQVEVQKQAAMDSVGTGKNTEAILMIGKTLATVCDELEAVLASEESKNEKS